MCAENLLDQDLTQRLQIKSAWYLDQGLRELRAENGGNLPVTGTQPELSGESPASRGGIVSPDLANASLQRLTARQALRDKTPEELEAFMRNYDHPAGRWIVFEGFPGCTNSVQITCRATF